MANAYCMYVNFSTTKRIERVKKKQNLIYITLCQFDLIFDRIGFSHYLRFVVWLQRLHKMFMNRP